VYVETPRPRINKERGQRLAGVKEEVGWSPTKKSFALKSIECIVRKKGPDKQLKETTEKKKGGGGVGAAQELACAR